MIGFNPSSLNSRKMEIEKVEVFKFDGVLYESEESALEAKKRSEVKEALLYLLDGRGLRSTGRDDLVDSIMEDYDDDVFKGSGIWTEFMETIKSL